MNKNAQNSKGSVLSPTFIGQLNQFNSLNLVVKVWGLNIQPMCNSAHYDSLTGNHGLQLVHMPNHSIIS